MIKRYFTHLLTNLKPAIEGNRQRGNHYRTPWMVVSNNATFAPPGSPIIVRL
jgi:hypothetical protein